MIEIIYKINIPKLDHLDLNNNYFEDFYIFKAVEHFIKLKYLNMCSNRFNEDISKLKNVKFEFPSLEEILLENGLFNNNSILLLSQFDFKKLKILKLDNNDLNSLSFIDKLNSDNIEELTLPKVNYEDIIFLIKFGNLKKINIDYFENDEIPYELLDNIDNISEISTLSDISDISDKNEEFSLIQNTSEITI